MLALAFGVIFGVVRIRSVLFFLLFLLLLPFLFSSIIQGLSSGISHLSWKGWIIAIFVCLVAGRLILNRFRR